MQDRLLFALLSLFLAIVFGLSSPCALASGPPSFTISATNATMPTSGSGSIRWTLTSINGYAGTLQVNCDAANPPMGAKLPLCGGSVAPVLYTLTANEVLNGSVALLGSPVPCSTNPCPVNMKLPRRPGHGEAGGLALGVVLWLGFGFVRRPARWLTLALFALGIASLAGTNACGGNSSTLTPGVWQYTVMATDTISHQQVTTTINVTVPTGVPTSF